MLPLMHPILLLALAAPALAANVAFGPFTPVWPAEPGNWHGGLLLAPSGDLLVFNGSTLLVLARDDGRVLKTVEACRAVSEDGIGWVGERIALACDDELRLITWPALTASAPVKFTRDIEQA